MTRNVAIVAFLVLLVAASTTAAARTFVFPHVIEREFTISTQTYTIDTTFYFTFTSGVGGTPASTGAAVDLYLFGASGTALTNNGLVVCAPCSYSVGPSQRKQSVRVDELIVARGGSFDSSVKLAYAVVTTSGEQADGVTVSAFTVNSHTGPFDLDMVELQPVESKGHFYYSIPHILERSGTTSTTTYTFDHTIFATYTAGQAGLASGAGATLALYLFDNNAGSPLANHGENVCFPCSFTLDSSTRKLTIGIDALITARGGSFDSNVKLGHALIVLTGDTTNVSLTSLLANAHTGPFDLSLAEQRAEPIGGVSSSPCAATGDVNKDLAVNTQDIFYLINHLLADGPPPVR